MPTDEDFDDASPSTLVSTEEVSKMIEDLASDSQEVFDKAVEDLKSVVANQQDLATKQLLDDVPRLIRVASQTADEDRRFSLISLICLIPSMSDQGDATIRANLADFVSLFKYSASADLYYLVNSLEEMLEKEDEAFEDHLIELLETDIYNIPDYDDESAQHNHKSYASAIEGFENALVLSKTKFRNLAVKAGALNYLVMTTFSPDKATRLAAVSCLVQAFENVDELVEHVPDQDKLHLQGWVVIPMLGLLNDEDTEVADAVVKFVYGNDEAVPFFFAHEASIGLSLSLYAREQRIPHANASYCESLISWCSSKDSEAILEGFRKFWSQDDIEFRSKLQVLRNLAGSLVQEGAGKGGAIEFVQEVVQKAETKDGPIQVLDAIDKAMYLNAQFGHYLLLANALPWLLSTMQAEDPKLKSLASSILRHLLGSYRSDECAPLRNDVAPTLTAQDTLSRIVSNANDENLEVSASAFRLLAELLSTDTQDEYLQIVRSVVDEPLIHLAVDRLGDAVSSNAAVEFLSQVLQDESGSSSLVQQVLATRIPTAPAPFFAALYLPSELNNDDNLRLLFDASHQELVALHRTQVLVLQAANKAGAVPRVLELLREPMTTVEARRSAVRATYAVLSLRDVDRDIGRTNRYLPDIVAQLIGDGTTESLADASRLVNLLAEPSAPKPFKTWTALATPQTVEHLINLLAVQLDKQEQPDQPTSSSDVTAPELQSPRRKVSTEKEFELIVSKTVLLIRHLLPILAPFTAQLAKVSLAGFLVDGKSDLLELIGSFPTSDIVEAIRSILSSSKRPPLEQMRQMINSSEDMALAFYAGDIVPFLVSLATDVSSQEDDGRRQVLGTVLDVFKLLVHYHRNKPSPLKDIQAQFFQCSPLVNFLAETIANTEEYGTFTAYTMALDLFKLADGYPQGVALISTPELLNSVLKGFDDPDCEAECITPLLGLIAHVDLGAVGAILKQQIDALIVSLTPKQGRKRRQNNSSRFDKHQLLSRLKILVASSDPALKQVVLESGGLDLSWCVLVEGGKPDEAWNFALEVITALLGLSTEDAAISVIVKNVQSKLPILLSVWNAKTTPKPVLSVIVQFLGIIVEHDKPDGPQSVVEQGWVKVLVKVLSERPGISGGLEPLVKVLVALARSGDVGQRAVVDTFKEALQSPEALKSERKSGYALAIKYILAEGEDVAGFMVEAGAVDYAVRLLTTSDPRLLTIGASLSAALALTNGLNLLPTLEQLSVGALVDTAQKTLQGALASEDSEDEKMIGELQRWDAHLAQSISEVLRVVCGSLWRKDLLSVALTCRGFLEPALDELWYEIPAFEPLVACLPPDLLEFKVKKVSLICTIKIVHLRSSADRELVPVDLSRYLGVYARRIRVVNAPFGYFNPNTTVTVLSAELLRVLELSTRLQPGVFSPLISTLDWQPDRWEVAQYTFPAFTLFLNPTIQNLKFGIYPKVRSHIASLRYVLTQLPALKTLQVSDKSLSFAESEDTAFIHQCGYLTSSSWDYLENLTIKSLPESAIPHLSSLPNLTTVRLDEPLTPPLDLSSSQGGEPALDGFKSLQKVEVNSAPANIIGLLQRLPPTNKIQELSLSTYGLGGDTPLEYTGRTQVLINTIHFHLNPDALRNLYVHDNSEEAIEDTPLDMGIRALDISPLLKFHKLTSLTLFFDDGVWITPAQVRAVPAAWPNIEYLSLENNSPNHHYLIDHTHLLEIAYKCSSLKDLHLPFDASRITGEQVPAPILSQDGAGVGLPKLRTLGVGHSPIKSPSCVIYFLLSHFPELRSLDHWPDCPPTVTLNASRWEVVEQAIEGRDWANAA